MEALTSFEFNGVKAVVAFRVALLILSILREREGERVSGLGIGFCTAVPGLSGTALYRVPEYECEYVSLVSAPYRLLPAGPSLSQTPSNPFHKSLSGYTLPLPGTPPRSQTPPHLIAPYPEPPNFTTRGSLGLILREVWMSICTL